MASTYYIDPGTNVNSLWTVNSYTNIDRGIRYPTIDITPTPCQAAKGTDNGEEQKWGVTGSIYTDINITSITMWVLGLGATDYGGQFNVYAGGAWLGFSGTKCNILSNQWWSHTWSGLSLLHQDVNNFQMSIKSLPISTFGGMAVYAIYLEAIYDEGIILTPTTFGRTKLFKSPIFTIDHNEYTINK